MYSAPYAMVHLSKKELNLTHFYTIPDFLLTLWKDLAELTLEKLEVLKKKTFDEVMCKRDILLLRTQYIFTGNNGQM